MQYQVVGWIEYDSPLVEDAPLTAGAARAIVEAIREGGYLFTGFDHQERPCGAPVLNDGRRRALGQRAFAALMAEAQGEKQGFAYVKYLTDLTPDSRVMPEARYSPSLTYTPPTPETFTVRQDAYPDDHLVTVTDDEAYRYLEEGDILRVEVGETCKHYHIARVELREREGRPCRLYIWLGSQVTE